jgi:hypothetical protein
MEMTFQDKLEISQNIKPIRLEIVEEEMNDLINIGVDAMYQSPRCRTGNNIVDYFTFVYRLETRGKYNINFFEFIENIEEFKKKKFIQNMILYYKTVKNKNGHMNKYTILKEVYNICISAINIIRPLVYMEIYTKYKPNHILDFCAGWGGAAVASAALNISSYTGIEMNTDLQNPYKDLIQFLKRNSTCKVNMIFKDALTVDYSKIHYDFVFTSPPYYFIQKYANNTPYKNKKEMNELFYKPLFKKVYDGLERKGYYIINICKEVYENVLIELFGPAQDIYPYKKSKRQNNYQELCYVWQKG